MDTYTDARCNYAHRRKSVKPHIRGEVIMCVVLFGNFLLELRDLTSAYVEGQNQEYISNVIGFAEDALKTAFILRPLPSIIRPQVCSISEISVSHGPTLTESQITSFPTSPKEKRRSKSFSYQR